jgi:hypothetical protein
MILKVFKNGLGFKTSPDNHSSGVLSKNFPADTENGLLGYYPEHSP